MIPAQEEIDQLQAEDFIQSNTEYFENLKEERTKQIQSGFR